MVFVTFVIFVARHPHFSGGLAIVNGTPVPTPTNITYFKTPADLRKWFTANHAKAAELWVGYYKKSSGHASVTWPESVDEALCVGWIDGIRKAIDADRYTIRFTPRRETSIWSSVNIARMKVLTAGKRVLRRRRSPRGREQVRHLRVRAAARSARTAVRGTAAEEQGGVGVLRRAAAGLPQGDRLVDRQREEGRDAPGAAEDPHRGVRERKTAAMTSYVALLRGVNVGGNKMIAMAELRAMLDALGFEDAKTLLQSGNAVFRGAAKPSATLEALLEKETAKRLGLTCDYHVRTAAELQAAIDANPLKAQAKQDPSRLLVSFFKAPLDTAKVKAAQAAIAGPRSFAATAGLYVLSRRPGQLEGRRRRRQGPRRARRRSWNTVMKLAALSTA